MTEQKSPATDDSRTADGADVRRAKLADEAATGLRKAMGSTSDPQERSSEARLKRTVAADAIGTPAEGTVEDGEGASVADIPE